MKIKLLIAGLILPYLVACTNERVITEVQIVKVMPPVVNQCQRLTIKECKPQTNGDLFLCAIEISKQLSLCANQTDVLINWQNKQG